MSKDHLIFDIIQGNCLCPHVYIGHAQNDDALTGCTVILFDLACIYSLHVSGGAVSLRQVSGLIPHHSISVADAILITGGSAYGLDSAGGVLRYLEEKGRGIAIGNIKVPSVPTAAIFDLRVGDGRIRPSAQMGYSACMHAISGSVPEGRVGAGAGATVGKINGIKYAEWGGFGVSSCELDPGLFVTGVVVVNAFGNIVDPHTHEFVAGARDENGKPFDAEKVILLRNTINQVSFSENTTIGVIVTNAKLTKEQCQRVAIMASQSYPLCIRPAQTSFDGDVVFVASTGEIQGDVHQIGIAGRELLCDAIVRAVKIANRIP